MSKYQALKAAAHREVCEWMRCLDWRETLNAEQLGLCALSYFRNRHNRVPRFKKATKAFNARQTVTKPQEQRRSAIRFMARRDIIANASLFDTPSRMRA